MLRLLYLFSCCILLSSCTTTVTEVWSWNPAKEIFVQTLPPEKSQTRLGEGDEHTVEERGFKNGEKTLSSDLDGDGLDETFTLSHEKITATEDNKIFWESPDEWRVTDIILADSTNDGVIDLNIASWRNANYGSSKPFWEEENDTSPRHHFFVMKLQENTIMPVWQSSNLEAINQELRIADVDGDKKNELIVLERNYEEKQDCTNTVLAVWRWNEWGFYNVWKGPRGNYCGLEIENGNIVVRRTK